MSLYAYAIETLEIERHRILADMRIVDRQEIQGACSIGTLLDDLAKKRDDLKAAIEALKASTP